MRCRHFREGEATAVNRSWGTFPTCPNGAKHKSKMFLRRRFRPVAFRSPSRIRGRRASGTVRGEAEYGHVGNVPHIEWSDLDHVHESGFALPKARTVGYLDFSAMTDH